MPGTEDNSTELGEIENVRVVVRVRPLSSKELDSHCKNITDVDALNSEITVENPNAAQGEPPKVFSFDAVFDTDSTQVDIYNETARPIVDKVLQGYNGTIFAYGQTGTGKTYTMSGAKTSPQARGIIPNTFAQIFGHIAKADENQKFLVRATYLEIYNEEVRDLLGKDQNTRLEVKERPDIGVFVKDLSGYVVNNIIFVCMEYFKLDLNSRSEKEALREKMQNLQNKILVGGENLLEKAEAQEQLLAAAAIELEQRKSREEQLKKAIKAKEAERIDIEEKYSSLQEEAAGKTKKLARVYTMLMSVKAELSDLQQEHQREMEGLLEGVRGIGRELQLQNLIVNHYIPVQYQTMIKRYLHWNEDIGEWQLKCVAYTGNNMRKAQTASPAGNNKDTTPPDMSNIYLSYNTGIDTTFVQPKKVRSRSGVPRPTTAHRRTPH
ncbi:kinesin-like protein KIF3A [Odontomachus brunneus]|uniref:kinesin-like protein KIF3A n=1 Tax=Odontomachus brunneus TaxID=486640 RepID=UPI0013F22A09|nr:kinesin-like protein KIF3A [Odontomachus brunneus]